LSVGFSPLIVGETNGGKGREPAVKAARPDARDAIRVAAATGLRRGELFALRWRDIDFDQNLIYVRASNFGGRITETTKTTAGRRTVPLFVSIRQLLLDRKAREPFSLDHDFIFSSAARTPLDLDSFRRREWKKALEDAKLPHFRFHDLRHFAVSQLIEQRADILLLARIAGHKDPSVTLRVYAHLMNERVTEAADLYDPLKEATSR
jgi:integrase